jgi:2-phospho-L-lactate guanylyltransferase
VTTWAVVPVKGFERGKSRLAPVLADEARAAFARRLFERVLDVLAETVDGVLVATDSDAVAAAAAARGAAVRRDAGPATLAAIVDAALADVAARGATRALVLMADLPRLTPGDVRAVLAALDRAPVVVCPDRRRRDTNALALAPPTRLATAFGTGQSFAAHRAAAGALVVDNEHIGFDVDGPEELSALAADGSGTVRTG